MRLESAMDYPQVLDEHATLAAVVAGASLARYGDGEFNLCRGRGIPCQRFDARLAGRLREILQDSGDCLVGLPNIHSDTPKAAFWSRYLDAAELLVDRPYVSAFISRPDSAPWVDTPAYWERLESLWEFEDVLLVRGSGRSLTAEDLLCTRRQRELVCRPLHAWSDYRRILQAIGRPHRVLLCLGPTATVLAVDLCAKGVHAIDLGHVGLFLKKHRRGEPLAVTATDKAS